MSARTDYTVGFRRVDVSSITMQMLESTFEIEYPPFQYWRAWNVDWIREEFYDSDVDLDPFIAHKMSLEHVDEFMRRRGIARSDMRNDDHSTFANVVRESKNPRRVMLMFSNIYDNSMTRIEEFSNIRRQLLIYGMLVNHPRISIHWVRATRGLDTVGYHSTLSSLTDEQFTYLLHHTKAIVPHDLIITKVVRSRMNETMNGYNLIKTVDECKVINPETGKWIRHDGPTYRKLIAKGYRRVAGELIRQ